MNSEAANRKPRLSQQDKERHYFELFRRSYTLPAGKVEYGDKPDVTITGLGLCKLGIEITNFYHEDGSLVGSEQRQASRRAAVASLAQALYLKNGGKNIEVKLNFDKSHPIEDAEAVARNVAEFANGIEDRKTGQIPRHLFEHIPELDSLYMITQILQYREDYFDPEFPDGQPDPKATAFVRYRNRREAQAIKEGNYKPLTWDAKWQLMQAHSFGLMGGDRLTEILCDKEEKAQKYRPCDAYWLLVIVDWMDAAQEQEIRVDGLSIRSDMFERVIIYKPHFEHVVDVLTTKHA